MAISELSKQRQQQIGAKAFGLSPEDFVTFCAGSLRLTEREFSNTQRDILIGLLYRGESRLKVIESLTRRVDSAYRSPSASCLPEALLREFDDLIVIETMVRFAPDDNDAFVRYAFRRILGRSPEKSEAMPMALDLINGELSRSSFVYNLVRIARRQGKNIACESLLHGNAPASNNKRMPVSATEAIDFATPNESEYEVITLCERSDAGWSLLPGSLFQDVDLGVSTWQVSPGWILGGPKRVLVAGLWCLVIEIEQAHEARLRVDIVANAGLTVLYESEIMGAFSGTIAFAIEPHHLLVEVRLYKPDQNPALCRLSPRRIRLQRLSAR